MKLKCPHCAKTSDFSREQLRKLFLSCPGCEREFRPNETSPLVSSKRERDPVDNALSRMTSRLHFNNIRQKSTDPKKKGEAAVSFLNSKGIASYRQKRYAQAKELFEKSLSLRPDQNQIRKLLDQLKMEADERSKL